MNFRVMLFSLGRDAIDAEEMEKNICKIMRGLDDFLEQIDTEVRPFKFEVVVIKRVYELLLKRLRNEEAEKNIQNGNLSPILLTTLWREVGTKISLEST